jgi:hypothetical protein
VRRKRACPALPSTQYMSQFASSVERGILPEQTQNGPTEEGAFQDRIELAGTAGGQAEPRIVLAPSPLHIRLGKLEITLGIG